MADEGAIKAGDAYVEMTLDKSKLDKGMADTGKTLTAGSDKATASLDKTAGALGKVGDEAEQAGKKGGKNLLDMDARAKQLTNSLWRMTGGLAMIHVSATAIGGAFEAIGAGKELDKALRRDDLNAAVASYRKLEQATQAWYRSLPLIGGMLGKISDAFRDRSLEQFANDLQRADDRGQSLANTLSTLADRQIALMKLQGATPAQIQAAEAAKKRADMEEELAIKGQEYMEARKRREELDLKRDKLAAERTGITTIQGAREWERWEYIGHPQVYLKVRELEVTEELARAADVEERKKKKAWIATEKSSAILKEETEIKRKAVEGPAAQSVGMQAGAALAGAAVSGVAWGVGGVIEAEQATPQEQLVSGQATQTGVLGDIKTVLDKIEGNTSPPPPPPPKPYGVL